MYYKTCPRCGAHLDPGEQCDCMNEPQEVKREIKEDYKPGDRVASTIMGFYYGLPGKVLKLAQMQHGNFKRFVVELEKNEQQIILATNRMRPLAADPQEKGADDEY